MIIDLHTHSTISDGSLFPRELVKKAADSNVELLALCDHDTTGNQIEFLGNCEEFGIKGIVGIELSAIYDAGNCHLLGYGVSDCNSELENLLKQIRDSREFRNIKIVEKLNSVGINITLKEIFDIAGGDVIARPHIARAMLNAGAVSSVQEAFDNYLVKGQIGYVGRFAVEPEFAINILKAAGAKVVLAHPTQLKLPVGKLDLFVSKLKDAGLWGIEVYTPYTPQDLIAPYINIAKKYDLKITAGSDFHGISKPKHFLGELINGAKIETTLKNLVTIDELEKEIL